MSAGSVPAAPAGWPPIAMILAAGRGERMRPLTDATPKPLLSAGGRPLIEWQLERLAAAGIRDVVVNHAWLGEQIPARLGDGSRFGVTIRYAAEPEPLETVGGIVNALPLLGARPFILASGDVYCDFDYRRLEPRVAEIAREYPRRVAHFVLMDNPPFHPEGDFAIDSRGLAREVGQRLNYGGIAVYHPALFKSFTPGVRMKLFPWARQFVAAGQVSAEHHGGRWVNVGTSAELLALDALLSPRGPVCHAESQPGLASQA